MQACAQVLDGLCKAPRVGWRGLERWRNPSTCTTNTCTEVLKIQIIVNPTRVRLVSRSVPLALDSLALSGLLLNDFI